MSGPAFAVIRSLSASLNGLGRFIHSYRRYVAGFAATGATSYLTIEYLFESCYSEGASMYATIPDRTNMLFVNKTYRRGRGIKVGDCVQIASPLFPRQYSGKRVLGIPGDYVLRSRPQAPTPGDAPLCGITDWKKRLDAERAMDQGVASSISRAEQGDDEWVEPEMIQVPEGHVWVEGDNLGWSRDSRFFGPVPMALIKGRSSWFSDGLFSFTSLNPGKGLRKVEDWEIDAVLGDEG